jgi:hypothetical protein
MHCILFLHLLGNCPIVISAMNANRPVLRRAAPESNATTSTPAGTVVAPLVLKVPEFGARWGVRKTTVNKWLASGMPHMKISYRNTQIPIAEADAWVKENFLRQREG